MLQMSTLFMMSYERELHCPVGLLISASLRALGPVHPSSESISYGFALLAFWCLRPSCKAEEFELRFVWLLSSDLTGLGDPARSCLSIALWVMETHKTPHYGKVATHDRALCMNKVVYNIWKKIFLSKTGRNNAFQAFCSLFLDKQWIITSIYANVN